MYQPLLAAAIALAAALPATAATFTDEATFLAAAPGATSEDFEGSSFDGTTISFGGGTITCAGGSFCDSFFGLSFGGGLALSGINAPFFGTPDILTFVFAAPINAFGIFIGGAGDVGTQNLTAELSDGTILDVLTDYTNGSGTFVGNTNFFGVTSATPFTSVSFAGEPIGDGVFFDDMSFRTDRSVAPIPLPATALLLAGAVLGLGAIRRRAA
jgi:hypothetical protein